MRNKVYKRIFLALLGCLLYVGCGTKNEEVQADKVAENVPIMEETTETNVMPEDHVMIWNDEVVEKEMREITGIEFGDIMLSDVWDIKALYLSGTQDNRIKTIDAISELTNLENLEIKYVRFQDLDALRNLKKLKKLVVVAGTLYDINALAELTELESLTLQTLNVENLEPLRNLTKLEELSLTDNKYIRDLEPLSNLTNLDVLGLSNNAIIDISPLSNLKNLRWLYLNNNYIRNVEVLSEMTALYNVSLSSNEIVDVSCLADLPNLSVLDISRNFIIDTSALEGKTNLLLTCNDNPKGGDVEKLWEERTITPNGTLYHGEASARDISDNWQDFEFIFHGVKYSLQDLTVGSFEETGWAYLAATDLDPFVSPVREKRYYDIPSRCFICIHPAEYNKDEILLTDRYMKVYPSVAEGKEDIVQNYPVYEVRFGDNWYCEGKNTLTLAGGVTHGYTQEEVIALYGEPDMRDGIIDEWLYYFTDDFSAGMGVAFDKNNRLCGAVLYNYANMPEAQVVIDEIAASQSW